MLVNPVVKDVLHDVVQGLTGGQSYPAEMQAAIDAGHLGFIGTSDASYMFQSRDGSGLNVEHDTPSGLWFGRQRKGESFSQMLSRLAVASVDTSGWSSGLNVDSGEYYWFDGVDAKKLDVPILQSENDVNRLTFKSDSSNPRLESNGTNTWMNAFNVPMDASVDLMVRIKTGDDEGIVFSDGGSSNYSVLFAVSTAARASYVDNILQPTVGDLALALGDGDYHIVEDRADNISGWAGMTLFGFNNAASRYVPEAAITALAFYSNTSGGALTDTLRQQIHAEMNV